MDDRAGPPRGRDRVPPRHPQDAGEREVRVLQRPQDAGFQRRGRVAQRLDQFVGALVSLAALADAPIDDLLEVVAARQPPDVVRADPRARVSFDQHAEQLPDLEHVVARLPLRRGARKELARRRHRVERSCGDAALIALLPDDAEVAELQMTAVAHEDVDGREVAVQHLAAVQLAEDLEDAGDLAPRGSLRPSAAVLAQVRAEVAVRRVLEREAIMDVAGVAREREGVEDANRPRMTVEELAEVGFAQPAVDARTDFDADRPGHVRGTSQSARPKHLTEAALAEPQLDAVAKLRFRADDDLSRHEQAAGAPRAYARERRGAGRRFRGRFQHATIISWLPASAGRKTERCLGLPPEGGSHETRGRHLSAFARGHYQQDDARDECDPADDRRDRDQLVLFGLRFERTDVHNGLLLRPGDAAVEHPDQTDDDQDEARYACRRHGVLATWSWSAAVPDRRPAPGRPA